MQSQGNIRVVEMLRYLYQHTDENHPATVTDITAYLKERGILHLWERVRWRWISLATVDRSLPMVLAMADLVEPLEIPVRMIRRSSRVRCEKAFE